MKSIRVTIKYDRELAKITGKRKEVAVVNEGLPFIMMLYYIFKSYPSLEKKYPPGKLAMKLNGLRPEKADFLKDKDEVELSVFLA